MIAVDTSAILAIIWEEQEAARFSEVLGEADAVLICAVSVMEASFVLAGRGGTIDQWRALDALIQDLEMQIVPFDGELAYLARDAFLRFGKGRHPARLNMGDCASYALAKSRGVKLLFKGDDFPRTDIVAAA